MKTLLAILAVLAMAVPAMAESLTIHSDWDFNAPPADNIIQPTGFNLYKNDTVVCNINDPAARQLECAVLFTAADLTQDGSKAEALFSLTATDNRGLESDKSAPFLISVETSTLPSLPAPVLVIISVSH